MLVYAADAESPAHDPCRRQLLQWRSQVQPWYLTWGIIYEFLRVTTHPRVFRSPWTAHEAWGFIKAILASPSLTVLTETERHARILADLIEELPQLSGNLLHDTHTAALMLEHGLRVIYTRDTDFHRFPQLEVRDPLR